MKEKCQMRIHLFRSLFFGCLLIAVALTWLNRDYLTTEAVTAWVEHSGYWGPAVFVEIYTFAPALFFPGSVLTLAGGALFGPFTGALLGLTGATLGATVAFLIARYLAAEWVERRVSGRLQEIKEGVEREGWRFVAFVRLVPLFPFNLLNYALGLTRLSVRTFAVTSFITMAPGALASAYLGDAGREAVSGGPGLVRKGLLALALLAAVALLPSLIPRWRRLGKSSPQQLQTLLSQGESPLVLDVRNLDEFIGSGVTLPGRCFARWLAVGFLYTEGLIRSRREIVDIEAATPRLNGQPCNTATVTLTHAFDATSLKRNFYATSSCGSCGKASLAQIAMRCEPIAPGPVIPHSPLVHLPQALRQTQQLFDKTGRLHATGLFDRTGRLWVLQEDVGRHNAVNNVIGHQWLAGETPLANHVLMVSGRLSFEIMQKAAMARVPIVCAVSAPSSLAVETAKRFCMTLVGFLRDHSFNVYAHSERIALDREDGKEHL
jgi:formate dehydrogenase accessory protein FdhD